MLREVRVDRRLVREDAVLLRAVADGHDVDVVELRAAFAPVAVGEDVDGGRLRRRPRSRGPAGTRQWKSALKRVTRSPVCEGFTCSRKVEKRPMTWRALRSSATRQKVSRSTPASAARACPEADADFVERQFALQREEHLPFEVAEMRRRRP